MLSFGKHHSLPQFAGPAGGRSIPQGQPAGMISCGRCNLRPDGDATLVTGWAWFRCRNGHLTSYIDNDFAEAS